MKKIILKRSFSILAILFLLFALAFVPTDTAFAKTIGDNQHIYDKAELLSTSERSELEDMCAKYSKEDNVNIIILTHNDSNAVYAETYIENFYDQNLTGNSVILLVDMYNRDVFIEGYGSAENSISSSRGKTIINDITPDLSNGDYSDAFEQYIKLSDKYINMGPIYENVWIHLAIALVIGIITVVIMAYNAGGKLTVGGVTYMDPNNSGLIGRRDDYIRTQVTRIRKPQNNGGGGGGGISAGGSSHSSAGGKF